MIDSIIENRLSIGRTARVKDVFSPEISVEYMEIEVEDIGCDHRHYFSVYGVPMPVCSKESNYIRPVEIGQNQIVAYHGFPLVLG